LDVIDNSERGLSTDLTSEYFNRNT